MQQSMLVPTPKLNRNMRRRALRNLVETRKPDAAYTAKFSALEQDLRSLARKHPENAEQFNTSIAHLLRSWAHMMDGLNPRSTTIQSHDRMELVEGK